MSTVEINPAELLDSPLADQLSNEPATIYDPSLEAELEQRFDSLVLGDLATKYLVEEIGPDWGEKLGDRQFVVGYIPAENAYADLARSVETLVFSEAFLQSKSQVVHDYGKYDEASTFVAVIDAEHPDGPRPAAALRITHYKPGLGFKDVNDLVANDPENNPWLEEIKARYFDDGEQYDEEVAWERMGSVATPGGLVLADSLDVASHAGMPEYRGKNGSIDSTSMLFYHACLRYALAARKSNLLAIFDTKPYENLQQFGEPFDPYDGLTPHPYGGPYDTIPAYSIIGRGMKRIRDKDAFVGQIFIDGLTLDDIALMPNEYDAGTYSNKAVGLPPIN